MKQSTDSSIRVPTEHEEQRAFVAWFEHTYKEVRLFAIPNGGARNPVTAHKLKLEGVRPGVPDLFLPEWRLWIEFKRTKGGTVSAVQKDWHSYLAYCGYTVMVAKGCEDARQKLLLFTSELV